MRRRARSAKAQQALWNYLSREIAAAAAAAKAKPKCGCPVNAPEADHAKWPCPCGEHCKECRK